MRCFSRRGAYGGLKAASIFWTAVLVPGADAWYIFQLTPLDAVL
jgi:hypothetical protein